MMDINRISSACTDEFIRPDEWRLLLQDEESRQSAGSIQKYQEVLDEHLTAANSMTIAADNSLTTEQQEGILATKRAVDARCRVVQFIETLMNYTKRHLKFAEELHLVDWARRCFLFEHTQLKGKLRRNKQCIFLQQYTDASEPLYEVCFKALNSMQTCVEQSPVYVVSAKYMVLIRCLYVIAHVAEFLRKVVESMQMNDSEEHVRLAQHLNFQPPYTINHAARYIFIFFNHHCHVSHELLDVKATQDCICKHAAS